MMEWILIWIHAWARLLDGLIGVVTLGSVYTSFGLETAKVLSKFRREQNEKNLEIK